MRVGDKARVSKPHDTNVLKEGVVAAIDRNHYDVLRKTPIKLVFVDGTGHGWYKRWELRKILKKKTTRRRQSERKTDSNTTNAGVPESQPQGSDT